jgi:pyridoxal phosphate-dependent aminotransferase EpsN
MHKARRCHHPQPVSSEIYFMHNRLFLSPPHMGGSEQSYVAGVFASNWIAPIGPMVDQFELHLAELIGVPDVVALSSGTAALHLALKISGINAGDQVWGPTMTFIGGVAPILYEGAVPVFLDVDPATLLLDLDLLEISLRERVDKNRPLPKVIITTDLYGGAINTEKMRALVEQFRFIWISDSAEALGSRDGAVHAGKGADFVVLSFNGNKIITTSGGGALGCKDVAHARQARFLSTQARDPAPHYEHTTYGFNYRLSNVCAAIGVGQLEVLDERVSRRRAIHAAYFKHLGNRDGITFHAEPAGSRSNRWLTTIELHRERAGATAEEVRLALEGHNIESRPLWKPMHLQPLFHTAETIRGDCAVRAFDNGLCLPSGSAMTDAEIHFVADIILNTLST